MTQAYTGQGDFGAGTGEAERVDFVVRQVLNRIVTATLVQVKAVREASVDVVPMVAQIDGAGNAIQHGTINNVPWLTMRAGTSAVIIKPVVGDIGLAVFAHNDISSVKKNKAPSNPGSRRRFDWADALYVGGFFGDEPDQYIRFDPDGVTVQAADGKPIALTTTDKVDITGPVETDTEYRVNGTKVVGEQQAAIAAPIGGATNDAESRTAINAIRAVLQAHGLTA